MVKQIPGVNNTALKPSLVSSIAFTVPLNNRALNSSAIDCFISGEYFVKTPSTASFASLLYLFCVSIDPRYLRPTPLYTSWAGVEVATDAVVLATVTAAAPTLFIKSGDITKSLTIANTAIGVIPNQPATDINVIIVAATFWYPMSCTV